MAARNGVTVAILAIQLTKIVDDGMTANAHQLLASGNVPGRGHINMLSVGASRTMADEAGMAIGSPFPPTTYPPPPPPPQVARR